MEFLSKDEKYRLAIIDKVNNDEDLTREEELFYMTEVLNFTRKEAEHIYAIAASKNSNLLHD